MKERRRRYVAAAIAVLTCACGGGNAALPSLAPAGDPTTLVERGQYIVRNAAVCGHCHAADPQKNPDGPLSGGYAFRNWRLGTVRAANITPDPATGIGAWSDAEIVRALRAGQHRAGGVLAPVMPYVWFRGMSDQDALAVARYLKSQPPVSNAVENDGNLVYEAAKFFVLTPLPRGGGSAPLRGVTAEYGRYLANHVALCADCHTPRGGVQNQSDLDELFAGDDESDFPANPANLTPDNETGIGRWSEADFLRTLRTGVDPAGDTLHPFMPWREVGRMTDDDLRAIYRYLRTLAPIRHEIPEKKRNP
jgi:mono/diheme cytochrome c family protein